MADFLDRNFYEIVHPKTGRTEVWTGERINAYQVVNRVEIEEYKAKKPQEKKRTYKKKSTK